LRPESAEELLRTLVGDGAGLASLKRLLIERTEGNPFFLEESVRTLVETGALAGERGAFRLIEDAQVIQVPATVQALLAGRIDRLPPEEKRLLQAASVIGKDVPFALLQAIVEDGEGGSPPGARAPSGRRVPLRSAPLPRAGVHVQVRPDARSGLREPLAGATDRTARKNSGSAGAPAGRRAECGDRASRSPRAWSRGVEQGDQVPSTGGARDDGPIFV